MEARVTQRMTGIALMALTIVVYFSRPWSLGNALSQFRPDDPVPYARFDYHGWGVMFSWLVALVFAAPMLGLAAKVFLSPAARLGVLGRGPDTKTTILSAAIALGLGAPMLAQISYLEALPLNVSAAVLTSSLAWLLVVEIGRTAAVRNPQLGKAVVSVAAVLAVLVTIPKVDLIVGAIMNR